MPSEQTARLIETYDLAEKVKAFVREQCRKLAGVEQKFAFRGSAGRCPNTEPHVPHQTGGYSTVRYGWLQYFCLGQSGPGLEVVIEQRSAGAPEWPGSASGYWLAKSEQKDTAA